VRLSTKHFQVTRVRARLTCDAIFLMFRVEANIDFSQNKKRKKKYVSSFLVSYDIIGDRWDSFDLFNARTLAKFL